MARTRKPAESKTAAPSVVEAVKEVAESVAAKATTKKTPAKKKVEKVEEIYLQSGGAEWNVTDCKKRALAAYVAGGHKEAGVKKLAVYLKPEEGKAYYVVNDEENGSIDL